MSKRKSERLVIKMNACFSKGKNKRAALYSLIIRIVFACDIQPGTSIDETVQLIHNGLGCVFHPKTIIGKNCKIYQNVTLGGNGKIVDGKIMNQGAPILEDNVAVFAGACVLGPITIGAGSVVGANAVITKDVPPHSLVFGNPATVKPLSFEYNFD